MHIVKTENFMVIAHQSLSSSSKHTLPVWKSKKLCKSADFLS